MNFAGLKNDNTISAVVLAGFIWGFSGFTVELVPHGALQIDLMVRLAFVVTASILILIFVPLEIDQGYLHIIALLFIYVIFLSLSCLINSASIQNIYRELLLLFVSLIILFIIRDDTNLHSFLKGIFLALITLITFYAANINYNSLFSPYYRLYTKLNPNGIGMMGVMLFIFCSYYLKNNIRDTSKLLSNRNIILIIYLILSTIVVLATRSRAALVMLIISYFTFQILYKNRKTLLTSTLILITIIITNFEEIDTIARISEAEGYGGKFKLTNLSGRTEIWKRGLDILSNNYIFGVGPDNAKTSIFGMEIGFHNAYLQLIITAGILGFAPLFIIISNSLWNLIFIKRDKLIKVFFFTGLAGSFVESRLLNFGSPANLLFFLSLIYLSKLSFKSD